ncbi:hypothetical protein FA13DRAFT_1734247 [Coprinellus micaceus]|uniref:Uncharacterized protein n=1 Tax=Coprinellus micaceus TaxID=71717 RepID=A0A4Y7T6T7_COPMI|nr:hypothetical protein FA13DRAFT_1734247 [Coprinellus micaceus]
MVLPVPNLYQRKIIDVNGCASLTRIEIQINATDSNHIGQFTGLAWIAAFMASITPSNALKTFRLKLLFCLSNLPETAYGELRSLLCGIAARAIDKEQFPCLERLEVRVFVQSRADNNQELYQVAGWVSNALSTFIPLGSPLLDLEAVEGGYNSFF